MAERLTLDEVIVYEKESAKDHREKAEYQKNRGVKGRQIDIHIEAETEKAEWREQLVEWFEELKHYKDLKEQNRLIELPCKIGDTVYGIRRWHDIKVAKAGTVSEMFYTQEGKLMIVVKYVCRGHWGEKIFATLEEAEAALKEVDNATRHTDI